MPRWMNDRERKSAQQDNNIVQQQVIYVNEGLMNYFPTQQSLQEAHGGCRYECVSMYIA